MSPESAQVCNPCQLVCAEVARQRKDGMEREAVQVDLKAFWHVEKTKANQNAFCRQTAVPYHMTRDSVVFCQMR